VKVQTYFGLCILILTASKFAGKTGTVCFSATPKAARNEMSNTRNVLTVRTAVSLPEGYRSNLRSICCGNSEEDPSTEGLVVTSASNWVLTVRKICAKNAFLSLFSPYSFVSS
jgi:hypothetical protein